MSHASQGRMMCVCRQSSLHCLVVAIAVVHMLCVSCVAGGVEGVDHYKMISTVEYAGDGQFRNQVETAYSVTKEVFANDRVRYAFATRDPGSEAGKKASSDYSFVIDRGTGLMSATGRDMAFFAQVNNETVKSLEKVTREYIGKTWKQSVDLSSVNRAPFSDVTFTLTAIDVTTKAFGDMVAVRALSEPFLITISKGPLRCRANTVYLFDADIDTVYLGISVFEAATDARGTKEMLRHEVATYRTDATLKPLDLSDVGKNFEALVARVGLRKDSLQITKESDLPAWARSHGIPAAQVANICAGAVCEGALNPVGMVTIPQARAMLEQALGAGPATESILAKLVNQFGWNIPTAAVVAAITTAVVVSQDDDSKTVYASPP